MSSNNRLIAAAGILLAALVFAGSANATLFEAVSFDDKVGSAQSIILGRCTETRTAWDPEHRWILTYATIAVDETLKGAPVREVTVVTPGGTIDGIHQSSVGITPLQKGDERVLFVKNTRVGPTVAFFDQGTYAVSKDAKGERIILPVTAESVRIDRQTGNVVPAEQPRTLRQFIGELRASQRRIEAVSAGAMVRERQAQQAAQPPIPVFRRYWLLFALAGLGAAFATWQILRK